MHLIAEVLILVVCAAQFVSSQDDNALNIHDVPCEDQQETCTCNNEYDGCDFTLEVEELQTFTSYRTTSNDNKIISRGTPGATYLFGPSGYEASLDESACSVSPQPPECNSPCRSTSPISNDQGFRDMNCSIPMIVDGRTYRMFIAVNGLIPGPTLIVWENQTVRVNVINRLTSEGITIHWHGMHQRGTPWMDGVASLSQIPIVPGASFQYIFRALPAGTHWYHSHLGAQRTDGLFGGLIVRERESSTVETELGDFEDIPEEHTLTLLDWQREASLNLFVQIHSTLGFYPRKNLGVVPNTRPTSDGIPGDHNLYSPRTRSTDGIEVGPVPYWSGLINGRGRYDSNTYSNLSSFNVREGQRYRFRLIGAQSLYAYRFEIVEHKLTVIATDGQFVTPVEVDYIIIHSGERYDFILNASQTVGNYLIRVTTLEVSTSETGNNARSEHSAEAILHYEQATYPLNPEDRYSSIGLITNRRNCIASSECYALNCPFEAYPSSENTRCIIIDELTSLFESEMSDLPKLDEIKDNYDDRIKFFNFGFEGQSTTSAINGRNFLPPPTPYQLYCGQYGEDVRGNDVNTCNDCNSDVTADTQPEKCTCVNVVTLLPGEDPKCSKDKSVMMVFSAVGNKNNRLNDFAHPVHLHGHSFYIVYVGHGMYDANNELDENSMDVTCNSDDLCMKPNFTAGIPESVSSKFSGSDNMLPNNTVRKDTVIVPAGGYVVVAFKADNPGYWFLHCHIEVHQLEGMAVIIQEYNDTKHNFALPENITKVGNFKWSHEDFVRLEYGLDPESSAVMPGLPFTLMVTSSIMAAMELILY